MRGDTLKRLPLYSLASGAIVAIVLMVVAVSGAPIPNVGLGALGLLPLAAALVDAVRLRTKFASGGPDRDDGAGQGGAGLAGADRSELGEWLAEKAESLAAQEQELNARALSLQQWMQFPDAIDFKNTDFRNTDVLDHDARRRARPSDTPEISADDPMARHDRELLELVESKTRELFDSIKQDAYRKDSGDRKLFDNEKIRTDLVALVSDVVAIYRPGETAPLLKTNVDAVSRAVGRASLRLLVAVESLPGGLANYDFQSIYNVVMRAVKTFGIYKSAKPYIDVASNVLFAGRIVSSTNPLTLVAWWAASKATTYGASKLGAHVLDQQAVGLIRQLVEIIAIEVASIYSPMVRYRDVHWIYGVELVHLASELAISDSARVTAMNQLSALNLRDEYGRVSLLRHLADGSTSRPANYQPAQSLSASDRKLVAERLEAFLLTHVLGDKNQRPKKALIDAWQTSAADRLEIQFRVGQVDVSPEEQTERAIWALASFALQHFGDEPAPAIDRLKPTQTFNAIDSSCRARLVREIQAEPPFLYHPPSLGPDGEICKRFLTDLIHMAAGGRKPAELLETGPRTDDADVQLVSWSGEEAIRVTAYFMRADADELIKRYHQSDAAQLLDQTNPASLAPEIATALHYLVGQTGSEQAVRCVFSDAKLATGDQPVALARIGSSLICFRLRGDADRATASLTVLSQCALTEATIEKVSGYVRSDCRVIFPDATAVLVPGSTLAGYDAYFAGLLNGA
ncbi:hypothetical protein Enr13x_66880 [Stieleria neptunia]|uniref:Uncharacterized protein n=1 Tax=Stieleria neptunia TaxID=2527979 RepID=A0A518I0Y0_9BACT|nr:hypothetical protein [Stieleria neptunia]QDV46779.1 hypothetical protein Enr13x_66880 [Stieleria neptunia]